MQSQTSTSLYSHKFWFQLLHPERKCSLYSVAWIIVQHKRAFCKSLCSICDKCSDPRRWWRAGAPSDRAPVKFMQASKLLSTVKKEECLLSDNILGLHIDLQTPAQTFTYTSMFKCKTHFLNNSTKSAAGFQPHEVPHPPSFNIHHHVSLSSYSNRRIPIWILARRGGERVPAPSQRMHGHKCTHWILVVAKMYYSSYLHVYRQVRRPLRALDNVRKNRLLSVQWSAAAKLSGVWTGSSKNNGVMVRVVYCCRKVWDRLWPSSQKTVCFSRLGERRLKAIIFHQFLKNQIKFGKQPARATWTITWKHSMIANNNPVNSPPPYHLTGKYAILEVRDCLGIWGLLGQLHNVLQQMKWWNYLLLSQSLD